MFKHPKKVWSGDAEDEYGWPPHRLPAATHLTAMHTLAPSKCCAAKAVFGLMWMGHGDSRPCIVCSACKVRFDPGYWEETPALVERWNASATRAT